MRTYNIVRFYMKHSKGRSSKVIREGVSLEEAQKWCNDPDTRKAGEWFDGYVIAK